MVPLLAIRRTRWRKRNLHETKQGQGLGRLGWGGVDAAALGWWCSSREQEVELLIAYGSV
jgi:hypothetical protein